MSVYIVERETKTKGKRFHVRYEQGRDDPIIHLGVFATEEDAIIRRNEAIAVVARGEVPYRKRIERKPPRQTMREAGDAWIETLHDLAPRTIKNYRRTILTLPAWLAGMHPQDVTHRDVQRFVDEMKPRFARTTIERELVAMLSVLDYAGVPNPSSGRKLRLPRKQRKPFRLPSREDIAALHAALPDRVELLVFLEHTGLRIGEAAMLRWGDFDAKRGRFLVQDAKTAAGRRWVEHLPGAPVFPDPPEDADAHGVAFSPSPLSLTAAIWHAHKRGACPLYSAHDFRHLHASRLLHDGVLSPAQIAARLGHADPGVTLRVYSHVVPPES